ncbi:MAG: hypothetical protein KGV57_04110 [Fusobacterium sp.]|nr:hypothetical protein [Fusobacterium sp.]
MATTSFDKEFVLDSEKAIKSFEKIISSQSKSIKIGKEFISEDDIKRGEEKLKSILSR